jgi:hypothetical protein
MWPLDRKIAEASMDERFSRPTRQRIGGWRIIGCMRRPRLVLAFAFTFACGCIDDPGDADAEAGGMCEGDPATFVQGELIEWVPFGHDFGEFCSAGFDIAEDHARWVAQAWGTDPMPFRYGLFDSREHECWPCAEPFGACVLGEGQTFATSVPHRHEIVHAVRPGFCFPLIEEGWAMLYGDHFIDAPTVGDIRTALEQSDPWLPGEFYTLAARFVAFLQETRGAPKLRELCDRGADDSAQFEAAVLDTYGVGFDELASEFDSYPEWTLSQLRQGQACESTDVIVGPTAWDFAFECGAPGIEGKLGVAFETQRLVELPEEDVYQLIFESPIDLELRVELRGCAREGMASSIFYAPHIYIQAGVPKIRVLPDPYPAGVYVVRVRIVEPTQPVDLHMSIQPWP